MPLLTVVAGPNGSGKSTLTSGLYGLAEGEVIDPDVIARRLDHIRPASAALPAARRAILRCRELLAAHETFTLETTLAGQGGLSVIRRARAAGYRCVVVYIAMNNPELHIERVRLRASRGGHDIPDTDVRRRYWRSIAHAPKQFESPDTHWSWITQDYILYGCWSCEMVRSSGMQIRSQRGSGPYDRPWSLSHLRESTNCPAECAPARDRAWPTLHLVARPRNVLRLRNLVLRVPRRCSRLRGRSRRLRGRNARRCLCSLPVRSAVK
jgi:predicted ABC-type ATPase